MQARQAKEVGMKIMFVGSTHWSEHYRQPFDFPFKTFKTAGQDLGYHAARRGHTILICSDSENTLDRWVMEGAKRFAQEVPQKRVSVVVYYPRRNDRVPPYRGEEFRLPNLDIRWSPHLRLKDEAYSNLMPHLAMLDACDAIVALGGADNTFVDGCIASYRRNPALVVLGSGGAADLLYDRFGSSYSESEIEILSDQWKPHSAERIIQLAEARPRSVDVAIICPLPKEREAVRTALEFTDQNRTTRGKGTYWLGRLQGPEWTDPPYEVVVAQLPGMGTNNAALTTSDVINDWHPRAVFIVGIAASAGDTLLGDVVVGSAVLYYEAGKVTPDGIEPEPYMYPADAQLYHKATTTGTWMEEIRALRPDGCQTRPGVHYGVIASGEKVVADQEMRDAIVRVHRKMAAIEMEAFGVAAAASRSDSLVRQLAIRGICDTADRNKNDDWQDYAAAAAASFVRHYLLERPL
jgi:nucleoside phosphorylase